jgi:hypothetical protein
MPVLKQDNPLWCAPPRYHTNTLPFSSRERAAQQAIKS